MRAVATCCLFLALLFVAACDSSSSPSPLDVGGSYNVSTWTFTPNAGALDPENVQARLDPAVTLLSLASGRKTYSFNFGMKSTDGTPVKTYIIAGGYDTEGDNKVVIGFGDKNADRRRLLLPAKLRFTFDEAAGTLTYNGSVSGIDLEAYDQEKYRDSGLNDVKGTLNIVLTRR